MEFLRSRALQFLEQANYAHQRGYNELALFNVEQFFQLYVKYLLYKQLGEYPRTHSLKRLLEELVRLYQGCGISEYIRENSLIITLLEQAYISSRYLPFEADEGDVEAAMDAAKRALEIFKCLENL